MFVYRTGSKMSSSQREYWALVHGDAVQVSQPSTTDELIDLGLEDQIGEYVVRTCMESSSMFGRLSFLTGLYKNGEHVRYLGRTFVEESGEFDPAKGHVDAVKRVAADLSELKRLAAAFHDRTKEFAEVSLEAVMTYRDWIAEHARSARFVDSGFFGMQVVISNADEAFEYKLRWV